MPLKLNYQLMKPTELTATLDHMAEEILKANDGRPLVLLGIQRRGVPMARRMAMRMAEKTQTEPQIGTSTTGTSFSLTMCCTRDEPSALRSTRFAILDGCARFNSQS